MRKLEIRVRDLEASRENWKVRARAAARMVALTSFRGASRRLAGLSEVGWEVGRPSAGGIRPWRRRVGLYELQRSRRPDQEWGLIVDLSIQWGPAKVLVIVAVPRSRLPAPAPALSAPAPAPALPAPAPAPAQAPSAALGHQDVPVVGLAVLNHSTGEVINQHLEPAAKTLSGTVFQIVADGGRDVKKGIALYCQAHPESRYTSDVTHEMARLLKHELETDERFGAFVTFCQKARQGLQPTPLSFLIPPPWRCQGRWLQVANRIEWALRAPR